MSKINEYVKTKEDQLQMLEIIQKTTPEVIQYACELQNGPKDLSHRMLIAFVQHVNGGDLGSQHLASRLGKAVQAHLSQIVATAAEISKKKLASIATGARDEALEVLDTLGGKEGEHDV